MNRAKWIALGALAIGTLDIAYAIGFWGLKGTSPARILQSVAAGVQGRAAFSGGARSAALGLVLHYFIAFMIVLVYWMMSQRIAILSERPLICGAIYGLFVYAFMNYVVIPLSATSRGRFNLTWVVCSILVHAFLVGMPAGVFARRANLSRIS